MSRLRSSAGAAGLVTLATLLAAYAFTPGVSRAAGEQDPVVFQNFHELETRGGVPYRWSKGGHRRDERASVIALPQVGRGGGVLQLQVRTPEDAPPVPLSLSAGGRTLLAADVHGRSTLSATIPRSALEGGDLRVVLSSPAWTRGRDARARGVAVERVGWTPSGWALPPVRQLFVLPSFAAALALLLGRLRVSSRAGRLGPAVAGGLLAIAAAGRPLEVAPFTHRLLIGVVLAHAAVLLWAALVRSPGRRWWEPPGEAAPGALVLLIVVGYQMLVAYHGALCWETHRFCPTVVAGTVGLIVLGSLAVVAAWPATRARERPALLVVALGAAAQAVGAAVLAFHRPAVDFTTLWTAARDFTLGGSLYKPAEVAANHFGAVFKVPPFYGMLLLPFSRLEVRTALGIDRAIDVVLYLAAAAVLFAWLRARVGTGVAVAGVAAVLGLMQPAFDTIAYGQIDIVILLLGTLALVAFQRGRHGLLGLALALATLLKLYPLVLALFLAARREWKSVAWTGGWLVVLNAVAVATLGGPEHVVYATEVLPRIGGGTGWVENQTWNGFLARLLLSARRPEPVHDRTIDLLTWAGFALAAGASAIAASRCPQRGSTAAALHFGLFLVVMVMAVPAAWIHYETVTAITFLALVASAAQRPLSAGSAFALALAFGLVAYGNQWTFYDGGPRPGLTALLLSRELYGLALLWAMALVAAQRLVLTSVQARS